MDVSSPQFWVAGFQIIVINRLLSGDNAIVIALACRNLPPDPVVVDRVNAQGARLHWAAPIAGILLVIGIAQLLKRRRHDPAGA